jgi:hypothetical protein
LWSFVYVTNNTDKICDCPVPDKKTVVQDKDPLEIMDFKTDQLEISGRKFPLRSAQASAVRTDSPSQEVKRTDPDAVGGASKEARRTKRASHKRTVHRMMRMELKPVKKTSVEK